MSIGQIIVLTAVVGALVLFAAVLGWGDYHAQQQVRRIRDRDRKEAALAASAMVLKEAVEGATAVSGTAQARWPQPTDDVAHHWVS
jgi:hypothetical protein